MKSLSDDNRDYEERERKLLMKNTGVDSKAKCLEKDLKRKTEVISECISKLINETLTNPCRNGQQNFPLMSMEEQLTGSHVHRH